MAIANASFSLIHWKYFPSSNLQIHYFCYKERGVSSTCLITAICFSFTTPVNKISTPRMNYLLPGDLFWGNFTDLFLYLHLLAQLYKKIALQIDIVKPSAAATSL